MCMYGKSFFFFYIANLFVTTGTCLGWGELGAAKQRLVCITSISTMSTVENIWHEAAACTSEDAWKGKSSTAFAAKLGYSIFSSIISSRKGGSASEYWFKGNRGCVVFLDSGNQRLQKCREIFKDFRHTVVAEKSYVYVSEMEPEPDMIMVPIFTTKGLRMIWWSTHSRLCFGVEFPRWHFLVPPCMCVTSTPAGSLGHAQWCHCMSVSCQWYQTLARWEEYKGWCMWQVLAAACATVDGTIHSDMILIWLLSVDHLWKAADLFGWALVGFPPSLKRIYLRPVFSSFCLCYRVQLSHLLVLGGVSFFISWGMLLPDVIHWSLFNILDWYVHLLCEYILCFLGVSLFLCG